MNRVNEFDQPFVFILIKFVFCFRFLCQWNCCDAKQLNLLRGSLFCRRNIKLYNFMIRRWTERLLKWIYDPEAKIYVRFWNFWDDVIKRRGVYQIMTRARNWLWSQKCNGFIANHNSRSWKTTRCASRVAKWNAAIILSISQTGSEQYNTAPKSVSIVIWQESFNIYCPNFWYDLGWDF